MQAEQIEEAREPSLEELVQLIIQGEDVVWRIALVDLAILRNRLTPEQAMLAHYNPTGVQ